MKRILYILLSVAAVGCVKVDIHNTDHPTQGKLTLITDWSNRTTGVTVPESFTAELDGTKITLSDTTTKWPNLFDPGTYSLTLYNTASDIAISGSTATVAAQGTGIAAQPGHQFFGSLTTTIERDNSHSETVVMKQLTRDLAFDLTIAEGDPTRIKSITASLSGIAPSWDCAANTPIGTATSVTPIFTLNGNKLTASVRLLGLLGEGHELTLNFTFTDNKTQQVVSDIGTELTTFNTNKRQPLTLSGNVNTPVNTTIDGTISDWAVVEGGAVDAIEPQIFFAVGDPYPDYLDPIGVVFWIDESDATYNSINKTSAKGKIVGLIEAAKEWGPFRGKDEPQGDIYLTDGAAATKALILSHRNSGKLDDYPAFKWVYTTVNGDNINGRWYIPAKDELLALYGTKAAVNASLTVLNATSMSSALYWSSTRIDLFDAYAVCFNKYSKYNEGDATTFAKGGIIGIRIVSAF